MAIPINQISEFENPLSASFIASDGLSLVTPVKATSVIASTAIAPIGIALPIIATIVPTNSANKCHAFNDTPSGGGTINQKINTMPIEINPGIILISVFFIAVP